MVQGQPRLARRAARDVLICLPFGPAADRPGLPDPQPHPRCSSPPTPRSRAHPECVQPLDEPVHDVILRCERSDRWSHRRRHDEDHLVRPPRPERPVDLQAAVRSGPRLSARLVMRRRDDALTVCLVGLTIADLVLRPADSDQRADPRSGGALAIPFVWSRGRSWRRPSSACRPSCSSTCTGSTRCPSATRSGRGLLADTVYPPFVFYLTSLVTVRHARLATCGRPAGRTRSRPASTRSHNAPETASAAAQKPWPRTGRDPRPGRPAW